MASSTANGGRVQPKNPYYGLKIVQSDISSYCIYLPTNQQIAHIVLPPTRQYIKDAQALSRICKTLAERWQNP